MRFSAVESIHLPLICSLPIAPAALCLLAFGFGYANFAHYPVTGYALLLFSVALVYLIARRENSAFQLKHRLNALSNLCQLRNTYRDADSLLAAGLERLRQLYGATHCFVVVSGPTQPRMRFAVEGQAITVPGDSNLNNLAQALLFQSTVSGFAYEVRSFWNLWRYECWFNETSTTHDLVQAAGQKLENLFRVIGRHSLVMAPFQVGGKVGGQLYVVSPRGRIRGADIEFLTLAACQLVAQAEYLDLSQRTATAAVDQERRRISLDLHDSTIQPYLGLRMGLEAIRRQAGDNHSLSKSLDELCQMTTDSISELRRYVHDLKEEGNSHPVTFPDGVRQQATRFGKFYGIDVQVITETNIAVDNPLAGELLQIVSESLSNVGRHTKSRYAAVHLLQEGPYLIVRTVNSDEQSLAPWKPFIPRSISERVARLGGRVCVALDEDKHTVVTVSIPYLRKKCAA